MKLSRVIKILQEIEKKHGGNIECVVNYHGDTRMGCEPVIVRKQLIQLSINKGDNEHTGYNGKYVRDDGLIENQVKVVLLGN